MCISIHAYVRVRTYIETYALTLRICTHTHIATHTRMSSFAFCLYVVLKCHNKLHSLSLSFSLFPLPLLVTLIHTIRTLATLLHSFLLLSLIDMT